MKRSQKPVWNGCRLWLLASLLWGGVVFSGQTADWYVATNGAHTTGADWSAAFTNVQAALDFAAPGDTIFLAGQTFLLTNQVEWTTSDLTILGGYEADPNGASPGNHDFDRWSTVITRSRVPDTRHRILSIAGVTNGSLERVTLSGGYLGGPGGGVRMVDCNGFVFIHCVIVNNQLYDGHPDDVRESYGGGIYIVDCENVLMSNCEIKDNNARGINAHGGGIYAEDGSLTITNSLIARNICFSTWGSQGDGGGIWSSGTLTIRDSLIVDNTVQRTKYGGNCNGGGLFFNGSSASLKNVLMTGNHSYDETSEQVLVSHGALHVAGGDVSIDNCSIAHNTVAGVRQAGGIVVITNSIVWGNWSDIEGTVSVSHSLVGENGYPGDNNLGGDPLFEYGYYLAAESPAIGVGSDSAGNLGLAEYTVNTGGDAYGSSADTVNLGWHYLPGTAFDLSFADLYVSPDGDDGNSGTGPEPEDAFRTVTKALSAAKAGTCIHVAAGNYTNAVGEAVGETFPLTAMSLPGLQIIGAGPNQTVLDASGSGTRVMELYRSHRMILEGLTLSGGETYAGGGLQANHSQTMLLTDCVIENNTYSASSSQQLNAAGIQGEFSDLTIIRSVIRNNHGKNTSPSYNSPDARGGGVWINGKLTMIDSCIQNNSILVPNKTVSSLGGGLYFRGPSLSFSNVLVAGNFSDGYGGGLYHGGTAADLSNSTIADNGVEGVHNAGGTLQMNNCIVWHNTVNVVGDLSATYSTIDGDEVPEGEGNLMEDPLFEYGYYLADGSPAIGAGSATAGDLGLAEYAVNTAGDAYDSPAELVNIGWHYLPGTVFDTSFRELFVSPDGNDGNSGIGPEPENAFRTVTKALTTARDGTRIHIMAGDYTQSIGEEFPLSIGQLVDVAMLGEGADETLLNASGSGERVMTLESSAARIQLSGLTFTGGSTDYGGGLRINYSRRVLLSVCSITNNAATSSAGDGGGIYLLGSDVTLSNCLVRDNLTQTWWTSTGGNGGGIWSKSGFLTLRDTRLVNNSVTKSPQGGLCRGGGLYLSGTSVLLKNVLLVGNHSDLDAGDGVYVVAGTVRLANCTVADNEGEGLQRAGGDVDLLNCILWENGDDIIGDEVIVSHSNIGTGGYGATPDADGNLSADPLFADVSAGNYRLLPGSPSVNAGLLQDWMAGVTDLDGNNRVSMGAVDMGCYELPAPAGTMFLIR